MMWKLVFAALAAVFAVGLGGMVGGFQDADVNEAGVQNAINFAVVQHNRGTNDLYLRQVAEVVKVKRQVVAGTKYVITAIMAKTPCRKDLVNEVCAIHQDPQLAQPYQCTFTVWSRPWMNDIKLLNQQC
ncbi:cystatin C (amyloid angiopathy and cerebral hemorrhage) [Xiphias gladius]|uniref:cystatin C (amyloid angiopathy and cerebral hemorrhage) n=1 Tax=Xiphias gladius TaxID=8245 RepID=UPI001A992542|nr:cystatin C (amyloid angiopathy and cerebral hemorrhage) [Xiphias gladius]